MALPAAGGDKEGLPFPAQGEPRPACTLILDFQLLALEIRHPPSQLPHTWYFCE